MQFRVCLYNNATKFLYLEIDIGAINGFFKSFVIEIKYIGNAESNIFNFKTDLHNTRKETLGLVDC